MCVWGLIRVCWPRLIRGIGCISADQGAPSAWQCELSGLFPPISPHFQLPPFHRPKYTTPSNTFSCYFMATLHNSGFNPTYEAKSPVSMTEYLYLLQTLIFNGQNRTRHIFCKVLWIIIFKFRFLAKLQDAVEVMVVCSDCQCQSQTSLRATWVITHC